MLLATDWTAIGTFVAAGATVGLGGVTVWLVRTTKAMVSKAGVEISLQRERMEDETKPHVFPSPRREWGDDAGSRGPASREHWRDVLPVTNGGPGVALNVTAQLWWGKARQMIGETVPTSLAPGEYRELAIRWQTKEEWHQLTGALLYNDVPGAAWTTEFRIYEEGGRYLVEVKGTRMIKRRDGSVV